METIVLGGGCFWCLEAAFKDLPGVSAAVSGYAGGTVPNPTYEQVCSGDTGHAEVVSVQFNPEKVQLSTILQRFFNLHDPTQVNGQGEDIGTQYRSCIFYTNPAQLEAINKALELKAESVKGATIVTQVQQIDKFFEAEAYHQNYYKLNRDKNPYCARVIKPKLDRLEAKERKIES
eukprot:Gregarina_sp_Pseudo_9__5619@NODE_774_length_2232_cov_29_782034_g729_i0_p2_GENE_NODE_774_length_2232_cov_29_782034_g729_i0NODE_774_length_2232_cov_29_782034_g729_i0_p2_ORF_typecomplete_len183_score28_25PMSR/PF01625_21/1_1e60_NODE_774_length_2232_cov_29_782034_g729_i016832210